MIVNKVGSVKFDNHILNVYGSLDEPLFMGTEICDVIDYSAGNTWALTRMCEEDEKLKVQTVVAGQNRDVIFVTELGLYNILSQSRMPIARKWRRVVHEQLIDMRRERKMTIEDQFEEWDNALDDIYYDEEKGILMRSVTVPGGDVEQVPLED